MERDLYNENDHIVKLNSENWNEIVSDSTKDVLVEFYGVNCKFCQIMAQYYKQLPLIFGNSENIVITTFNTDKSVPSSHLNITAIPSLLFFPTNKKLSPVIFEEKEKDLQSIFQFVMKHQTTMAQEDAQSLNTRVNQYFESLKKESEKPSEEIGPEQI